MPPREPLFPDCLYGVTITPEFYPEVLRACESQQYEYRFHEANSESTHHISDGLLRTIRRQANHSASLAFDPPLNPLDNPEYSKERWRFSPISHIDIAPEDVENIIESLHRQAASLIISSAMESDTSLARAFQDTRATEKILLARALYMACMKSVYGREAVSVQFASQGKLSQTPRIET